MTTKKKTAKKATKKATKKVAKKKDEKKLVKGKEVDVSKLPVDQRTKRLQKIYKLERIAERKKVLLDSASRARRACKAEYEEACENLENEIRDQRFGPGPLFSVDGSDKAGAPQKDAGGNG